jgi:hypothetical protein
MPKSTDRESSSDPQPEYDFSQGERGKYAGRYRAGTNVVVLDPEVAAVFPDAESVNQALKYLIAIAHRAGARKRHPR